jgi:Flp pilus assembly pilin Flp
MERITEASQKIFAKLYSVVASEEGQTAIEYALVAVLIAIVLVFAFKNVDKGISTAAVHVNSALSQ